MTGNGGGIQQNTTVTLTVTAAPNFTISASPASLSVAQGNQGTSTITTAISGGFNSAISLSASGMPSGTTVSFNPNHDSSAGLGQLDHDHHGGASTPAGTYPITVTGNGGGIQQTTTVTLTVTAAANFTISASPASLSVAPGQSGNLDHYHRHQRWLQQRDQLCRLPECRRARRSASTQPRFQRRVPGSSTMTITVGSARRREPIPSP